VLTGRAGIVQPVSFHLVQANGVHKDLGFSVVMVFAYRMTGINPQEDDLLQ